MEKNKLVETQISDLTVDGYGVGRTEGRALFVPGALPGERVKARIIKARKNYAVGRLVETLAVSPMRAQPPCPAFGRCGGCTLQHLNYVGQLQFKTERVKSCLERIGGIKTRVNGCEPSPDVFGYRNKAAFPVGPRPSTGEEAGPGPLVGLYAPRSHDIVEIGRCPLQEEGANHVLEAMKEFIARYGVSPYDEQTGGGTARHVIARTAFDGGVSATLVVNGKFGLKDELRDALLEGVRDLRSASVCYNSIRTNVIMGERLETVYGEPWLYDVLCGLTLRASPGAFMQVNRKQAENVYKKAVGYAGSETVLDLYCGVGAMTLLAAKNAKRAVGVEVFSSAVDNARENARLNGVDNAEFVCADVSELSSLGLSARSVIVDPPRKGLDAGAVSGIMALGPERVVYVSCDPATLARDLKIFCDNGWNVAEVTPFDMFPNTTHVETVALIRKPCRNS